MGIGYITEKNACYNCIREAKTPENYLYPGVATPEFVKRIIPPNNEESIQIYADIDQEPDGDVWLFCCQKLIGGKE